MLLRFYLLGQTPAGLYADEASLGYNAYSLFKTGKDEYGMSYPILIRSFGVYAAPVYTYLLMLLLNFLELSVFTIRLPSAIFSTLTILFVFLNIIDIFFI